MVLVQVAGLGALLREALLFFPLLWGSFRMEDWGTALTHSWNPTVKLQMEVLMM